MYCLPIILHSCLIFPFLLSKDVAMANQRMWARRDDSCHQGAHKITTTKKKLDVWPDYRQAEIVWLAFCNTENHSSIPITTYLFDLWKCAELATRCNGDKWTKNARNTSGTVPFVRGQDMSVSCGQGQPRKCRKLQTLHGLIHCKWKSRT